MNFTLVLFVIIVVVSAFRGYRSGIMVIAARVVGLLIAYLAAIFFTNSVASLLQKYTPFEGLIAYMIAGSLVFVVSSILFSFLFSLLFRHLWSKKNQPNKASSVVGGLFGAAVGCIVGIMAVWFVTTIQEILLVKKGQQVANSSAFEQTAKKLTGAAIDGIVSSVTDNSDLAKSAAKLLSNPAENLVHYNRLSQAGELRNLLESPKVRAALDAQNPAALLESSAFKTLLNNPDFIALTNGLDLDGIGKQRNKQLATKLTRVWAQVKQVQNNPQYLEITQDPEIRQMLQSGNVYKLLNSAKIERLLHLISSSKTSEIVYQKTDELQLKPAIKKDIYRWVDKNGKVHYSDKAKR